SIALTSGRSLQQAEPLRRSAVEQGDPLLDFGHKTLEPSPDGTAIRDALKSHGLAQSLVFLQQLAEFGVPNMRKVTATPAIDQVKYSPKRRFFRAWRLKW